MMKVAYMFESGVSHNILNTMILPQLEESKHHAEVVGMYFFGDATYMLTKGNPIGERIQKLRAKNPFVMVVCDQSVLHREIDKNLMDGVTVGCFPDFFKAIEAAGVQHIINF
jgi:intracellular sulfur oxidation DsrE/DsrF family protein